MKIKRLIVLVLWAFVLLPRGCNSRGGKEPASPEDLISAKALGLAYLEENQLEDAEAEFRKLIEMDPEEVMGYANLGIVYLRMGSFDKAEDWLQKAIKLDREDPDVRLIMAKVYEMSGDAGKAVDELETILGFSPGNVKALFNLTEIFASDKEPDSRLKRLTYTKKLVEQAPGNIVPRLNLIEILIGEGESDQALAQLEQLPAIYPEFPKEAVEYFDASLASLQAKDMDKASVSFMIFHNYLKVTSPYQAGMMDLKGPGGSLVGSPVISFDQQKNTVQTGDWREALAAISFTDITASAGLDFLVPGQGDNHAEEAIDTHITASDYDGDGDIDLYAGRFDPVSGEYRHYLLNNDWGLFKDVSAESGIRHRGKEASALFADYDNDGYLDLFVLGGEKNFFYRNTGKGTFDDVSGKARIETRNDESGTLFFDYDHDGDLDLYVTGPRSNMLFRNNSDGTFREMSGPSRLSGEDETSTDAGFGDFDEDGDIDLFVVNNDGANTLFSNQREGTFRDLTEASGLEGTEGSSAADIGDYNNDGFLDLFVASLDGGNCRLYQNKGDGVFKEDRTSEELNHYLGGVRARDARFFDFDDDGYLDLLVVGEPSEERGPGICLFHNDGTGKFWLAPGLLPDDLKTGRRILTFDYNDDGDLDLAITGMDGGIRLLRNDGGNNNHFIKMKLVGLRSGSAKNNYFGIGAKVEVRSGSLYQSQVVTEPNIYFGLGPRQKAEVIRIVWTNGVPQNMFYPAADQDLVEEQILKGSCPFLYAWDGNGYAFVKDVMWRSALGMPLGIMGGNTAYAPPDPSDDYIRITGEQLRPRDGKYTLQITGELWETLYTDKLELLVVDHPDSIEILVDEQLKAPTGPGFRIFRVGEKRVPVSAQDLHGTDILPLLARKDDWYVSDFRPGRYQGVTEPTGMELDLGEIDNTKDLYLFLRGWIFPTDASINYSIAQSDTVQLVAPYIEAPDGRGGWVTIVKDMGIPMGKDKTVVVNLTGKVPASDPEIRIRTNMQLYWDQVFFIQEQPEAPLQIHTLAPDRADLHYRGFSRAYRKGGRYGPHWFDYDSVTTGQKWRDLTGRYTRYGDVLPLLLEEDDMYVIKNAGDETTIEFDAGSVPVLPEGWTRDFLIHSVGWVKDGDLNTATGQTVEPLPFHGMTRYPYGPDEAFPSDAIHRKYLREYNTREVTTDEFIRSVAVR